VTSGLWPTAIPGPLAGLKVIDLSQQLPGPYASYLLAELGASVVKVEPPGGDQARTVDPGMYARLNSSKRIIEADLKTDAGRAILYELVKDAGALVEASRPGVAARLGADPRTLSAFNPRLIYCSISGYGQRGPLATRGVHDLNVQASIGALDYLPEGMNRVGVPWVDLAAGAMASLSVTAAWHGGRSGVIDLGMVDIAASWAAIKPGALTDVEPVYGIVATRDGRRFAIAVLEDPVWQRLCRALGWSDWADDERYRSPESRRAAAAQIRVRLDAAVSAMESAEFRNLIESHDLPVTAFAPVDDDTREQLALRGVGDSERSHVPPVNAWWAGEDSPAQGGVLE